MTCIWTKLGPSANDILEALRNLSILETIRFNYSKKMETPCTVQRIEKKTKKIWNREESGNSAVRRKDITGVGIFWTSPPPYQAKSVNYLTVLNNPLQNRVFQLHLILHIIIPSKYEFSKYFLLVKLNTCHTLYFPNIFFLWNWTRVTHFIFQP